MAPVKASTGSPVKMVFAGNRKWWTGDMEDAVSQSPYRNDLIFTGRIPLKSLQDYTAAAFAAVYASAFEGFGIPVLEAMQSGVPVITSNVSALPEVAGGAALLCDPQSVESLATAMQRMAGDATLRKTLVDAGIARAGQFSWDKTARLLWASVERTAQTTPPC